MTRCKDDNMTRRQDDKSYQMLPKISKTARKKLPKVGKHCQTLPNVAKLSQQVSKVVNIKTQILHQVVKKCHGCQTFGKHWNNLTEKNCQKLLKIGRRWQTVPKVVKSCQKFPTVGKSCQWLPKFVKS